MYSTNGGLKNLELKSQFFMKVALIETLKNGTGVMDKGGIRAKKGKIVEFRETLKRVMQKNNALRTQDLELIENIRMS